MEELMTLKEVARYLRLSAQTVYKMVEQGGIPALRAGGQWRFSKAEVDAWMRNRAGRRRRIGAPREAGPAAAAPGEP